MMSRGCEIDSLNYRISLKFDRRLGNSVAETAAKFYSHPTNVKTNPVASSHSEILWYEVFSAIRTTTG